MSIYIGGLSSQTTEDDLREALRDFGQVSRVTIIRDKLSGEPRGFAFVEMSNEEETRAVIKSLPHKDLNGRKPVALPYP